MTAAKPLGYSDDATPAGTPSQILQDAEERAAGRWVVTDTSGRRIGDQRGYVSYRDAQDVGDAHFRATKKTVEYEKIPAEDLPAPAKRAVKVTTANRTQQLERARAAAQATLDRLTRELAAEQPQVRSTRKRRARRAVKRPATLPVAEGRSPARRRPKGAKVAE